MRRLFVLLVAILTSGCLDGPSVADSFRDAEERFYRESEALDVTFQVPAGNRTVVVAVHYLLQEEAALEAVVSVVDGPELANIDQVGPVEEQDAAWLTVRNTTAGTWRIVADVEGSGRYTFAVYLREPA